ncbi:MAG: response regulator transcription factor [Acidimicrobiales bacterium]|nr:response regulator transcription factor [Acidimicrobiales bacterium]
MRILLVEDDESMAATLTTGLRAEGYAVDVSHDGEDGLWRALEEDYDLVVLDIMLPGRNGYAVVSALRSAGRTVPVLMLTAKDGEWDQAEALDAGADDYLTKPFSYPVLLARLRALIRRAAGHSSPVLTVGPLSLDVTSRRVSVGDRSVELTAREFAVLEYLAHRPGAVVSKSELLQHVWEQVETTDPNVVEVYVGYLRRKIDTGLQEPLLVTVRGAGYRLGPAGP